jgi:hypothetical protein
MMKSPLKRFGNGGLLTAALSAVAIWSLGSLWIATPQQAFAQVIAPLANSDGAYLLSYYDVSTHFDKSQGGYGGPGHSGGSGDALVHIVNAGNFTNPALNGDICANIYVFNDVQEMQECCSCDLSPNALLTLSTINNFTSNPLTSSESLEAGVIKIVGVPPQSVGPGETSICPTSETFPTPEEGLHAWTNHTESMASNQAGFTPPFGFVTSTSVEEFRHSELDAGELNQLFTECAFINAHGSGHGICTCTQPTPTPTPIPQPTPTVTVSVAYANDYNNLNAPCIAPIANARVPSPWVAVPSLGRSSTCQAPSCQFIGATTPQADCNGSPCWDGGAIMFQNLSLANQPLTIDSVTIDFGPTCTVGTGTTGPSNCPLISIQQLPTDPWAPSVLPPGSSSVPGLVLAPGQSAILTETNNNLTCTAGTAPGFDNFDTTDLPPGQSGNCLPNGVIPKLHVTFTMGGVTLTQDFTDTTQVLNQLGVDQALCGFSEGTAGFTPLN